MNIGPQTLRFAMQYLKGLDMPASKEQILQTVSRNRAPQEVVDLLQQLPDQVYDTMDDIWRAIGQKG